MNWQRALGGIAAAAALASCAQPADSGSTAAARDLDADLLGRQFTTEGVAGTTASISFDSDGVTAEAGCNRMFGRARTDSGRLFVSSLGGTEIGCPPALGRQDAWWADLLASNPTYTLDGATLRLVTDDETVELTDVETANPDRRLAGTRWVLETLANGGQDGTASSTPGLSAGAAWLRFGNGASTEMTGSTGCGSLRATAAVSESSLRLGSMLTTAQACSDADLQAASRQVLRVLHGQVDYLIDGDVLTLTQGDASLVYRAASAR